MRDGYSHLPGDLAASIDKYERDITEGHITFNSGKYADESPDYVGGWIQSIIARHLPRLDSESRPNESPVKRPHNQPPIPMRADGWPANNG